MRHYRAQLITRPLLRGDEKPQDEKMRLRNANAVSDLASTAVSSEAWAKLRDWASMAGKGRLLLSGSVDHASLKTAVLSGCDFSRPAWSGSSRFKPRLMIVERGRKNNEDERGRERGEEREPIKVERGSE